MLEFDLRIKIGSVRTQRSYGLSEWVSSLLDKRRQTAERKRNKVAFLGEAIASAPMMMRVLSSEIKKDMEQFSSATSVELIVGPLGDSGIRIQHGMFPTFSLEIQDIPGRPVIHCVRAIKANTNYTTVAAKFDIQILYDGQNEVYYQMEGNDPEADASRISQAVLDPLLKLL
jgi:hypothetical protein